MLGSTKQKQRPKKILKRKQIVVETNPAWAVPYWTERRRLNPEAKITWQIMEV